MRVIESQNDLQSATQQLPDGMGGWNTVGVDYYRCWLSGASTGFAHGLKMRFGPEAYRLMFNASIDLSTASDSTVLPYADNYFEYDPTTWRVTKAIAAVCASCSGGGTTADLFAYSVNPASPAPNYNAWQTKTVQTLPDSSQMVVYSNYAGLPMLRVNIDSTGENMWGTFYLYGSDGQVIWKAHPSAMALPASLSTLEAYNDLVYYNTGTGLYQYLNESTGLIEVTEYFTSTNLPYGAVQGKVALRLVQAGQGIPVGVESFTYAYNTDSNGNTVYPLATDSVYPFSSAITTSYAYTWVSGTNLVSQKTTTPPVIGSGQNGSGSAVTIIEEYDAFGNLTARTDERGIVNNYTFDVVLSQVTERVLNYQSGITAPGVNVTTDFTYDDLARLTGTLGPAHTVVLSGTATSVQPVAWIVYVQSIQPGSGTWDVDQTWTGTGYATAGPTYTLVDPVSIANTDKDGRSTDQITSDRTTGSGALSPTDTFDQTDWQSWSSTQYNQQHQTISTRVYFLIPSSGTGTAGTNYGETDFGYDALERRNRVVAPGGTITRTVWTCPQWVLSVWVGTNDTGATDSDPTGGGAAGNNMVIVTANQYDGGSAGGDGTLTQVTEYVSATSGDTRVTAFSYDFRDRRTSMTDALGVYTTYGIDNLDRPVDTARYVSYGSTLIGLSGTAYDDRNRIFQLTTSAVDPSTGVVGNALTTNNWYDPSGNLLQQIPHGAGQVFTKNVYNGVNWVTNTYRGFNTSGTSYSQAGTVANDIIAEQTDNTYDEVGNLVSQANSQRLNDAPTSGSGSTGALSYGSNPKARVSYTANWLDGTDRQIATGNYGAIASFTRPNTVPSSSATVLVTLTSYDNAGRPNDITDPMGYVTQIGYDAAGRKSQVIEDYGTGLLNRTTQWTYTLDNLVATMTAINSTTGDQVTTYTYGTTLSTSGVARNDLLASITYPDSVSGSDVVSYTYNRLGQPMTFTDQRGTVRGFVYDVLGRLTDDCVPTVGSGTDSTVLRISTTYEVRGMVQTVSSYDNATPGSGTILNQVYLTYNSFAQLTEEQQDHGGAVSGSSPNVQYGYDTGASSSNEIRLTTLTYPNGRVITYSFGTSGGMNDYLNRVDTIQDTTSGTTDLASYTYIGSGTVVRITYPEPSVWLDLWGGTSGTFNGFDQFNRIIDQRWQNDTGGTPTDIDRYQYGYDQNSNRLWKANIVGTANVAAGLDELYAYDQINRLTTMQRGVLNGGHNGFTGTIAREMDYTLDPTGNWSGYLTKTSGTTDLNQGRTSNTVNEITDITESGSTPLWVTPAYDAAGNTTTMPQVADPTQYFTAVYDAWNRMVQISDSTYTVAQYQYDGRKRRIVKLTYSSGILSETRHFYYTDEWRNLEERVGTSTIMDKQYVWGTLYVDDLVCRDDATPLRLYAFHDANFNLTAIADTTGAVQERYLFDPYGERTIMSALFSVIVSSGYDWLLGNQSLIHDEEDELIYVRNRYVHPVLGSWMQREQSGGWYIDGPNLYEYEQGAPLSYMDPTGNLCFSCYIVAPTFVLFHVALAGVLASCPESETPPTAAACLGTIIIALSSGLGFYAAVANCMKCLYDDCTNAANKAKLKEMEDKFNAAEAEIKKLEQEKAKMEKWIHDHSNSN